METYGSQLTSAVGPEQYRRLADAADFYKQYGFRYIDTPWLTQQKVNHVTKPRWARPIHHHVGALNHTFHIVASGEQSFLQLQYEELKQGGKIIGRWQTITPCYRDEQEINDLHRIGFMKLELIDWDDPTEKNLHSMIDQAFKCFKQYLTCCVVENDLIEEHGFDIVSECGRIELGSYGIRKGNIGGFDLRWIYGTGLAEPRLTLAIKDEISR
jgi:hypothetical protein